MPLRILVPFDGSEPAREALEYAIELFPDGEFLALTVVETDGVPLIPNTTEDADSDERLRELLEEADDQLSGAERIATEHGVSLEKRSRIGPPAREIIDCAEESDLDHVVIGSRGRSGVTRLLLGSVAEVVVRHSPVPVTVVR
ncbi:universal stress protein [Natronococcus occultus]|uniref:Universal stress protein UspA-like protein n=1 Tax=Natronococcus occultus SP4 TaxID=694430 RepID=L0K1H3_9EURY|nr:universal stress protein [Natronococcus occultus]AGB39162.1 universal stress protein UspA-like protein [Natronococcus occultus SP4]